MEAGGEERTLQTDRARLGRQSGGAEECCPLVGALQLIMQVCSLLLCFGFFLKCISEGLLFPPSPHWLECSALGPACSTTIPA